MKLGMVDCSPEFLAQLLLLPVGSRVQDVIMDKQRDIFLLKIESDIFRDVPEGGIIPKYNGVFTKNRETLVSSITAEWREV